MRIRTIAAALTAAAALSFSAVPASADGHGLPKIPTITLEMAKKMADVCEAMSVEKGWRMDIAVVDRGADLVVFRRMDNAFLGSVGIAINKAKSSARFPFSTRFIAELAYGKDGQPGGLPGAAMIDDIIPFAGGLPIMAGEMHIGGIGVSGDTADNDEICAQAAIDAVAADLK
ncbi:MAG: heme-binding protein [Pseudomonadota bacterium]